MLKFIVVTATNTAVYLENKRIGEINKVKTGYQYTPKGKAPGSHWSGEVMATQALVRASLRSD